MDRDSQLRRMYDNWMTMWNGDTSLAHKLVARDCPVHQPPNSAVGPEGVIQMVEMGRAPFETISFSVEVDPIIQNEWLAARWIGTGRYRGGMPGATVAPGTEITFRGNDIWRVEDGKIAEYWVSSDGIHLLMQLGILPNMNEAAPSSH